MSEWATFTRGRQVWTRRRHGGLFGRAVPERAHGEVFGTCQDGRVVVEWDNGYTTAVPPGWLSTGADVDPGTDCAARAALHDVDGGRFGQLVDVALDDRETWERAWSACVDTMREAMVWHGLIFDPKEIYDGRAVEPTGDVTPLAGAAEPVDEHPERPR